MKRQLESNSEPQHKKQKRSFRSRIDRNIIQLFSYVDEKIDFHEKRAVSYKKLIESLAAGCLWTLRWDKYFRNLTKGYTAKFNDLKEHLQFIFQDFSTLENNFELKDNYCRVDFISFTEHLFPQIYHPTISSRKSQQIFDKIY